MKRLVKNFSRKGFTLVETLLATFILVVVSTMLINGFVATMGYSYQTSVYNKSGARNYTACLQEVAKWNQLDNCNVKKEITNDAGVKQEVFVTGREKAAFDKYKGAKKPDTLTFNLTGSKYAGVKVEDLYVELITYDDLKLTVPDAVQGYEFAPTNNQLADNRKAIKYYPEKWSDKDGKNVGCIVVMYDSVSKNYYWVIGYKTNGEEIKDFTGYKDADHIGSAIGS